MTPVLPTDRPLTLMVLGAGTMGHGMALLAAKSGHRVFLTDADPGTLAKARDLIQNRLDWLQQQEALGGMSAADVFERITFVEEPFASLPACGLVLEAISEDERLKSELYRAIVPHLPAGCIVASNTSYLNVFALAPEALADRLVIAHFYAPAYLIPLVDLVGSDKTPPDVLPWLKQVFEGMGQRPVVLRRFIPGYIVNRLQRAMAREIFNLLDNGYADPEEIDTAVQASLGLRVPVLGVVRRYDFAGLDVALKIFENPSIDLVSEDTVPRALQTRVAAGDLGVKTGRGFFAYGSRPIGEILQDRDRRLLALRRFMESQDVAVKSGADEK